MQHNCPRDGSRLNQHEDTQRAMWSCGVCYGGFLKPPADQDVMSRCKPLEREEFDPPICCPEDGTDLTLVELAGVSIDICPTCNGIWLDDGEIEKLQGTGLHGAGSQSGDGRASIAGMTASGVAAGAAAGAGAGAVAGVAAVEAASGILSIVFTALFDL